MSNQGQDKRLSLLESICNQILGILISLAVWVFVIIPIWDLEFTMYDNLAVTAIFFITSFTRSYVLRRLFNKL